MTRDEAAALLGVPADADADAVRQAWRFWARIAHPDAGGDPEHFARLDQARKVMLAARPGRHLVPAPRIPLGGVLRLPSHPMLLITGAIGALGAAILPAILPAIFPVALALAAAPAALAATGVAVWATRELLIPASDRGHRITMLSLTWAPLACGQLLVSITAGASLLPVLPLLALPIVAAIAALDPGSGLWR